MYVHQVCVSVETKRGGGPLELELQMVVSQSTCTFLFRQLPCRVVPGGAAAAVIRLSSLMTQCSFTL